MQGPRDMIEQSKEKLERVARAICETVMPGRDRLKTFLYQSDDLCPGPGKDKALAQVDEISRALAQAAITALSQEDGLEELRGLSEKATPGDWRANVIEAFGQDWPIGTVMDCGTTDDQGKHIVTTDGVRASSLNGSTAKDDAAFIAAAVNYVRAKLKANQPPPQAETE